MLSPGVCFITHPDAPSGVDLWRAFLPLRAIERYGGWATAVPLGQDLPMLDGGFPHVVVMNQRSSSAIGRSIHLRDTLFRPNRVLYVVDVCDDPEWYPETPLTQRGKRIRRGPGKRSTVSELVIDHIRAAHLVTVNSPRMADICRRYNPHVEVMPDLIEPGLWDCPTPRNKPPGLFVGVAGGATHKTDWLVLVEAWRHLAAKHDWLHFVIIGLAHPQLMTVVPMNRLWMVGWAPIHQYQANYRWIDIGCAPLQPGRFNDSKSPIRWQEYALAGAYPICSSTVYGEHVTHRQTGAIADTPEEWVNEIEWAIDYPLERRKIIDQARNAVVQRYAHNEKTTLARLDAYARHYRRVYGVLPPRCDAVSRAIRDRQPPDVPARDLVAISWNESRSRANGTIQLTR